LLVTPSFNFVGSVVMLVSHLLLWMSSFI